MSSGSLLKMTGILSVGKIGKKRLAYIVVLTSIFWLSMNVLLLIANNEAALESLSQLTLSNEFVDPKFMEHARVAPLQPNRHINLDELPWMKKLKEERELQVKQAVKGVGFREVYDNSLNVNKSPGLGEGGGPAELSSEEDKKYAEEIFKNHSFNSVLSDKISLDRSMKDVRGRK